MVFDVSRWAVTKWFNPLAPAVWVPPKIRFNVFDSFTERQQWVHKCAVLCAWSIRFRRIMENWILYVCILIIWIYLTHLLTIFLRPIFKFLPYTIHQQECVNKSRVQSLYIDSAVAQIWWTVNPYYSCSRIAHFNGLRKRIAYHLMRFA